MKNFVFAVLVLTALFYDCKNEDEDYSELIIGKWVNTHVNDEPIQTDASFVSEFRADLVEMYAAGVVLNQNNKTWSESEDYKYRIEGKKIIIDGTDILEDEFHMEFEIISLDENYLKYSISKFSINGVEFPNENTYTDKKVKDDHKPKFAGVWYGKCVTEGTLDTKYHYWEYFPDGSFNYYYQNELNSWIRKSDNDGGYFLYDNLFASNFSNDLVSGGTGKSFECWIFEIIGNNMTWTGLREGGKVVKYEMTKVSAPPVVD